MKLNKIYKRDKGICWICGKPVSKWAASRDHVIPKAFGGTSGPFSNQIRLAHKKCNTERGTRKVVRNGC